jgi:hypothetical protein
MDIEIRELQQPDFEVVDLFKRVFASAPPTYGRHFIASVRLDQQTLLGGYINFIVWQPQVFLCGGLCVNLAAYQSMSAADRATLKARGSLSRLLSDEAIRSLGPARGVFAYTNDTKSRRDAFALGFVPASGDHLLVQWHDEPEAGRDELIRRVDALGPF